MSATESQQKSQKKKKKPFLEEIQPCNPDDYIGFIELNDTLQEFAREFRVSEDLPRLICIEGIAGSGRSSTLALFENMLVFERFQIGKIELNEPDPDRVAGLIQELKTKIDELAPEWRGWRQKGKPIKPALPVPIGEDADELTEEEMQEHIEAFMEQLEKVNNKLRDQRQNIAIFFDNIEVVLDAYGSNVLLVLRRIARVFRENNIRVLLVTSSPPKVFPPTPYIRPLELDRLSFADADKFLRDKLRSKLTDTDRKQVVKNSSRIPFDLMLRARLAMEGRFPVYITPEDLKLVFELTDQELKLLKFMGEQERNWFTTEQVPEKLRASLTSLETKHLLAHHDSYWRIAKPAVWDLLTAIYTPLDNRTRLELTIQNITRHADDGVKPSYLNLSEIEALISEVQDITYLHRIAQTIGVAAEKYIRNNLYHTAFEISELILNALNNAEDYEKAGDFAEELAKVYASAEDLYQSARSHEVAGRFFRKAKVRWRSKFNFREAGLRYRKLSESLDIKHNHFVIRAFLTKSMECYAFAEEEKRVKEVNELAKKLLKDYPSHLAYFNEVATPQRIVERIPHK